MQGVVVNTRSASTRAQAEAPAEPKAPAVKNAVATPTATINAPTINATINKQSKRSARDRRYRDTHRQQYNAYHRDDMRHRRSEAKAKT